MTEHRKLPDHVAAADFVRNFAAVRDRASATPIFVTHHGRDSHVLCSVEAYHRLAARQGGGDDPIGLMTAQLAAWIDQGLILIDRAGTILHANAALVAIADCDPARLTDRNVFSAVPALAGSLAEAYLHRALRTHEAALFEMQSPFHAESWLQCRLAPIGDHLAILLRDITRDVHDVHRLGEQEDVLRALEFNRDVAFVRLSMRAFVEKANRNFGSLIGLAVDRVIGVHFCDLIDAQDRTRMRDELEQVLGDGLGRHVEARLIDGHGDPMLVRMGLAPTRNRYASDGATIIVSPAAPAATPRLRRAS